MAITTWTNGLSTASGPAILGYKPTWASGKVYWLDSTTGSDSNSGLLEELPKATLASCMTAISANTNNSDVLLIKATHRETVTGSQAFTTAAGLTIIGLGSSTNRPQFTVSGSVDFLAVSVTDVWIENIYFVKSVAAATSRILVTAAGCTVKDCYFECGSNDNTATVSIGAAAHRSRVEGCYFLSNGTTAAQGRDAIIITAAAQGVTIKDCTFDGASAGWDVTAGGYALASGAALYFRWINNTFTGYSDANIATGAKGLATGVTQSGTGSFGWVP